MDIEFNVLLIVIETYLNISTYNKGELIYVASHVTTLLGTYNIHLTSILWRVESGHTRIGLVRNAHETNKISVQMHYKYFPIQY